MNARYTANAEPGYRTTDDTQGDGRLEGLAEHDER
jgi:hypothetical protein